MARSLRDYPYFSGAVAAAGGLSIASLGTGSFPFIIPVMFGSPVLAAVAGVIGAVNLFARDRGALSKTFSAAAAGTGLLSAGAMASMTGPGALGGFLITLAGMTAAGAFNVVADLTRNVRSPYQLKIEKAKADAGGTEASTQRKSIMDKDFDPK